MAAQNIQQVREQIANLKAVCTKATELLNVIFQVNENEEVVTQVWNNLATDFPELVDAGGVVGETFSPQHIKKAKDALVILFAVLQGTQATLPTGNLGRDIRRLTRGITA